MTSLKKEVYKLIRLKQKILYFSLFAGLFFLHGCSDVTLSVQFKQIDGLKQGDPVIFKSTPAGKVKAISYTADGDFLVSISVHKEFAHALTRDTRFYVGPSPPALGSKAIVLEQTTPGGERLEPGTVAQGSVKTRMIPAAQAMESLGQALEKTVSDMLENFGKIQESDPYKNFKQKLSELQTQLETSGKEMEERIRKDLLPMLEQKLNEIIRRLEQEGRQEEARELKKEFKGLQDI
jgi:ABC-type transporter Mla subunit MlaD